MVTVFVLCGIIGHLIGSASIPARNVYDVLYPIPRRRSGKSSRSPRAAIGFTSHPKGED